MSKEQGEQTILVGCEVGCLTGDLIACPLSKAEQESCPKRMRWALREKIKQPIMALAKTRATTFDEKFGVNREEVANRIADEVVNGILEVISDKCVMKGKVEIPMTGIEADMWQKGWRPVIKIEEG